MIGGSVANYIVHNYMYNYPSELRGSQGSAEAMTQVSPQLLFTLRSGAGILSGGELFGLAGDYRADLGSNRIVMMRESHWLCTKSGLIWA